MVDTSDNRRRFLDGLAAVAVIALALIALNRASLWWAVQEEATCAGILVAHAARNTSPFVWEMEHEAELELGPSDNIEILTLRDGRLRLRTTTRDPYLFLDFDPTAIPASDYPLLEAAWRFPNPSKIQLHFWEPGEEGAMASPLVEMPPGTFSFRWDLRHVLFSPTRPDPDAHPVWGGKTGAVEHFRVDLGEQAGQRVEIHRIALLPPPGRPRWTRALASLADRLAFGPPLPEIEAEALREGGSLPDEPWVRVLFTGASPPPPPPGEARATGPLPGVIGTFRRRAPFAFEPAADIARAWKDRVAFFEADFPWGSPEMLVLWKRRWNEAGAPVLFPRRAKASDLPASAPPALPGREERRSDLEPLRWAILPGGLLFFALALLRRLRPGSRTADALEALGLTAVVFAVLALFPAPGGDARAVALLASAGLFVLLAVWKREGTTAATGPGDPATGPLWARLPAFGLHDPLHKQAALTALGVTLAGLLGLWMGGSAFEALRFKAAALASFPAYVIKAAPQQVVLGPFLARRFERITGGRRYLAASLAAVALASLHLPNFTLAACSLLMGFLWASLFLLHHRLWPLILSHAILGTALSACWTKPLLITHRVGLMFFIR